MVDESQYQANLQSLNNELKTLQNRLKDVERHYREEIRDISEQHRNDYANLQHRLKNQIQEVESSLQREINQSNQQFKAAIEEIKKNLAKKDADNKSNALLFKKEAEILLSRIESTDLHYFDDINQRSLLQADLSNLSNIVNLAPEAGYSIAFDVLSKVNTFERTLIYLKKEWEFQKARVEGIQSDIIAIVNHLKQLTIWYPMLRDIEIQQTVDVDYWMKGKLSQQEKYLDFVQGELKKPYVKIDQLKRYERKLFDIHEQIQEFESMSIKHTKESLERWEIAEEFKKILLNNTFLTFKDELSGFMDYLDKGSDDKTKLGFEPYRLAFQDSLGKTVFILISNQQIDFDFKSNEPMSQLLNEEDASYYMSLLNPTFVSAKRNPLQHQVKSMKANSNAIIELIDNKSKGN